jgi:4-hydroxy-3-methylbut-2-enyl diphosphate reductase IspH
MKKYATIGVTAGASTPEFLITDVCAKLETL